MLVSTQRNPVQSRQVYVRNLYEIIGIIPVISDVVELIDVGDAVRIIFCTIPSREWTGRCRETGHLTRCGGPIGINGLDAPVIPRSLFQCAGRILRIGHGALLQLLRQRIRI